MGHPAQIPAFSFSYERLRTDLGGPPSHSEQIWIQADYPPISMKKHILWAQTTHLVLFGPNIAIVVLWIDQH